MSDKKQGGIGKRGERCLEEIQAECQELRQLARMARKEVSERIGDDPIGGLLGSYIIMFFCGIQIGSGTSIMAIRRRRSGRTGNMDVRGVFGRLVKKVAEKEKQEP